MQDTLTLNILLVDDEAIMRAALSALLKGQRHRIEVSEVDDLTKAANLVRSFSPDIILFNLKSNDDAVLDSLSTLLTVARSSPIIVLIGMENTGLYRQVITSGAMGIVQRTHTPAILFQAIEWVLKGQVWFEQYMITGLLDDNKRFGEKEENQNLDVTKIESLTEREREIIFLICDGSSTKQLAMRLFIAESTVRNHISSIFKKLDVSDRLSLVLYAQNHGLC